MGPILRLLPWLLIPTSAASAQVASAFLREGDSVPSIPGTVVSIGNTAVGFPNAYAASAVASDGTTDTSLIWGAFDGGPAGLLRAEGAVGGIEQLSFESFFGINALGGGVSAYSPTLDTGGGMTADSVWLNDTPIAIEGNPIPSLPGTTWRFASRPDVLLTNEPVWVGGINQGATSLGNGLFRGAAAIPVLKSLDTVPGIPVPLSNGNAIDFDFRFSPAGFRYITPVNTNEPAAVNTYLVVDGALLTLGGLGVREGELVAPSVGGVGGERWQALDFVGITDSGDVFFTGDTDGPVGADEFVFYRDALVLREGQNADGFVLTGSIDGGFLNGNGDIALLWDVVDGPGSKECLIFNGRVVLKVGDGIDFDGDGQVDPGAVISDFTGLTPLTLGQDRVLLALAEVDLLGTSSTADDVQVALRLPIGALTIDRAELSLSNGGTARLGLFPPAGTPGSVHLLLGSVSGSAPAFPVDGLLVPLVFDGYTQFTLSSANQPPLAGSFGLLDAFRTARATFSLAPGAPAALAGLTLTHAYVLFDFSPLPVVSYASPAVTLTLVP